MSRTDDDLATLVGDLVTTLQRLETEFEPRTDDGSLRPPTLRELLVLTSDVAIPATILLLRTNIEALRLLQRALRLADGRSPTTGSGGGDVRERAEQLSATTLSKLDGALADLQDAVDGQPGNDEARELLSEARELRSDIETKLEDRTNGEADPTDDAETLESMDSDDVPVDVDAELESLKDDMADQNSPGDDTSGEDDTDS